MYKDESTTNTNGETICNEAQEKQISGLYPNNIFGLSLAPIYVLLWWRKQ
jgi:hypothetical protein